MKLEPHDEVGDYPGCDLSDGKRRNCPSWLRLASSTPDYWWTQVWTLQSIKNGDAFDISGYISTNKTSKLVNEVGIVFDDDKDNQCAKFFGTTSLWYNDTVTMTGRVTPERADIVFVVGDLADTPSKRLGATLTFRFSGSWWNQGAYLVTTAGNLTTSGKSKFYKETKNDVLKKIKIITPILAVSGPLIAIIVIGCCCWRIVRKRKTTIAKPTHNGTYLLVWARRIFGQCDHPKGQEQNFPLHTPYQRQDSPPPSYSEQAPTDVDSSKNNGAQA